MAFQSTPPARGATGIVYPIFDFIEFQSTPPARGATADYAAEACEGQISIHAPREGGDEF